MIVICYAKQATFLPENSIAGKSAFPAICRDPALVAPLIYFVLQFVEIRHLTRFPSKFISEGFTATLAVGMKRELFTCYCSLGSVFTLVSVRFTLPAFALYVLVSPLVYSWVSLALGNWSFCTVPNAVIRLAGRSLSVPSYSRPSPAFRVSRRGPSNSPDGVGVSFLVR